MKPKATDYLVILAALVAIFLSGAAVGYVIGKRHGREAAEGVVRQVGEPESGGDWEQRTLRRLSAELELDEAKRAQVAEELRKTSLDIRSSRDLALEQYYRHLLDLHDRILPLLDDVQRARLLRDREQLEEVIRDRFENP